jgi:hypothetical protein
MPAEQGLGLDEQLSETPTREAPAEPGEKCPVRGPESRAVHVTPEHRHLLTEHDYFNGKLTVVSRRSGSNWRSRTNAM